MSGHGSSCGACKFLKRKCTDACVFAPFFCYEQGATHFAYVHKIFGARNASKLLSQLPMESRSEAALTICYEAQARIRDPTYGCVAYIFALQQQVAILQDEIETLAAQVSNINSDASSYKYEDQYAFGYYGFEQLPLRKGAMDLHQPSLEQQLVSTLAVWNADNLGCDDFFYNEDNQEFDTKEKAALHALAPGCSTLSDGFISEQGSDEKLDMDMIQLEACPTDCSFWSYSSQYQEF